MFAISASLAAVHTAFVARANADRDHRSVLVSAIATIAAIAVLPQLFTETAPTALPLALAIAAGALIYDAATRGTLLFVWTTLLPCAVLYVLSLLVTAPLADVHVADTLVMVAPLPLLGGVVAAMLWTQLARSRPVRIGVAAPGGVALTIGSGVAAFGFWSLGARGMPRRYFEYSPEYQSMQIVVGIGAAIALVGALLAIYAVTSAPRRQAS